MGIPPQIFLSQLGQSQQGAQQQDPLTTALMNGPSSAPDQQQPPPANNAQNAGPVKAGLRSVLAGMLGNFSYGAGQAMIKASGGETDAERATRLAQTAHLNAQTQLVQQQANMMTTTVPVTMPNGAIVHLPPSMAKDILKQQVANQGKSDVANTTGQYRVQTEAMKQAFVSGKVSKLVPGVNPDTGQPGMQMLNQQGQSMGWVDHSVVPALMARTSNTTEYKEDSDGNIIALPKQTTRGVVLPPANGATPQTPAASPTPNAPAPAAGGRPTGIKGKGATVMMVGTDPQGRQVAGTPGELRVAGVNNFTKLDSGEAAKVNTARQLTGPQGLFDLIDQDLAQFKPGELEGLAPRWNEFLAGTVGTADPRYMALRTHLNGLLSTALMQAHVGSRGGEHIMEHFQDLANAGKLSMPTLKAAIGAEKQYVTEKAMRPTPAAPAGGGGFNWGAAPKVR